MKYYLKTESKIIFLNLKIKQGAKKVFSQFLFYLLNVFMLHKTLNSLWHMKKGSIYSLYWSISYNSWQAHYRDMFSNDRLTNSTSKFERLFLHFFNSNVKQILAREKWQQFSQNLKFKLPYYQAICISRVTVYAPNWQGFLLFLVSDRVFFFKFLEYWNVFRRFGNKLL